MNTGPGLSLVAAILCATVFIATLGALSLFLGWVVIQQLPEKDRKQAWRNFMEAWGTQRYPLIVIL